MALILVLYLLVITNDGGLVRSKPAICWPRRNPNQLGTVSANARPATRVRRRNGTRVWQRDDAGSKLDVSTIRVEARRGPHSG